MQRGIALMVSQIVTLYANVLAASNLRDRGVRPRRCGASLHRASDAPLLMLVKVHPPAARARPS